jgi:hypothetical protein
MVAQSLMRPQKELTKMAMIEHLDKVKTSDGLVGTALGSRGALSRSGVSLLVLLEDGCRVCCRESQLTLVEKYQPKPVTSDPFEKFKGAR